MISYFFFAVGLIHVFWFLFSLFHFVQRHFLRKPKDLAKRYASKEGQRPWAIVTGAYGGLGEQYCLQLGKMGFDIVLIGRDTLKLENVAKKIAGAKTKCIQFDFEKNCDMASYNKLIKEKLVSDGITDIGLLVLNAGLMKPCAFEDLSTKDALAVCKVNMYHPTALMKVFIPLMAERSGRSGIINVSSLVSYNPMPMNGVYAATKTYLSSISMAIEHELSRFKYKIDV